MCGRFTLTNPAQVPARFDVADEGGVDEPRYNIAPTQEIPTIVDQAEGRHLRAMRWGFQPGWMTLDPKRPAPINARAETLLERPLFRTAVMRRRCLVVGDGYYEWRATPGQGRKQPYYIRLRDGGLFAMAGLYADGAEGRPATCAIITTAPNEVMAPIHNRMPAILDPTLESLWADPQVDDPAAILSCLRPYPAEAMVAFPVAPLVSSPRNDGPALIQPAS